MLQDFIVQQWREATGVNAYVGAITPIDAQQARDFFQQLMDLPSEEDARTQLSHGDTQRNRNLAWLLFDDLLKLDLAMEAERVQSLLNWTALISRFRDDALEAHCKFYQGVLKHRAEDLTEAEQSYAQAETSYGDIGADPTLLGVAIYALGVVAVELDNVEGERATKLRLYAGAREQFQLAIEVLRRSTSQTVVSGVHESIDRLLNQWQLVNELMKVDEPNGFLSTHRGLLDHQIVHLLKRRIWNLALEGQAVSEVLKAAHLAEVVASYLGQVTNSTTRLDTLIKLDSLIDQYIYSCQYDAAVSLLRQRLKTYPNDLELQKTLAKVLGQQGKYAEARLLLEEALKFHPNDTDLHEFLGFLLFRHLNDLQGAQVHLQRALELDPDASLAADILRHMQPQTMQPQAIVAAFQDGNLFIRSDMLNLPPGELAAVMSAAVLAAHPERSETFFAEANPELARRVAQLLQAQGLLTSPPQPTAEQYLEQAENFFAQARWQEAEEQYSLAIESDPNLAQAYMGLGDVYYRTGKYYLAMAYFEESIAIQPNQYAWRFLGDSYQKIGKRKDAIEAYQQALKLDPNYARARQSLQQLLRER